MPAPCSRAEYIITHERRCYFCAQRYSGTHDDRGNISSAFVTILRKVKAPASGRVCGESGYPAGFGLSTESAVLLRQDSFGQNSNPFRRKLQSASDKTGLSFGEKFWTHHSVIQNILQCNWIFTAVKIKMAGKMPHDIYVRIASHVRMCRSTRTLPQIDTIVRVPSHVLLCTKPEKQTGSQ